MYKKPSNEKIQKINKLIKLEFNKTELSDLNAHMDSVFLKINKLQKFNVDNISETNYPTKITQSLRNDEINNCNVFINERNIKIKK
ncbi:MAG: hypothetical protein Ta2E_06270 [Mycoplasmoidaceae bacterium]|nr:MAG: hypothetical protein Ta2E_06270 [Mycoplasmoidaceae bacterium]